MRVSPLQGWRLFREMCRDLVELCRGDHSKARLKLEPARPAAEREETEAEAIAHVQRWAKDSSVYEAICGPQLTLAEKDARVRRSPA